MMTTSTYTLDPGTHIISYEKIMKLLRSIYLEYWHDARGYRVKFDDLHETHRRRIIELVIKSDPDHLNAMTKTNSSIAQSFIDCSVGKITYQDFFYYIFCCYCDYYCKEINRALDQIRESCLNDPTLSKVLP